MGTICPKKGNKEETTTWGHERRLKLQRAKNGFIFFFCFSVEDAVFWLLGSYYFLLPAGIAMPEKREEKRILYCLSYSPTLLLLSLLLLFSLYVPFPCCLCFFEFLTKFALVDRFVFISLTLFFVICMLRNWFCLPAKKSHLHK